MGFKLVLLTRDNPVRQALSFFHGSQRAFHHRNGDEKGFVPLEVDPIQLLAGAWIIETETRQLREMVRSVPHLFLSYERDLLDPARHEATVTQVCEYIGIDPAPVATDLVKLAPTTLGETLANFDEVAALFRQTRYSEYLEDR